MSGLIILTKYSIPASLISFVLFTIQTVTSYNDESMISYGFPLSCYAPSNVSSMAYDIAIAPLIIDMISYTLICHFIAFFSTPKKIVSNRCGNIVSVFLWLGGLSLIAFTATAISFSPHFVLWELDSYFGDEAKRSYIFHLGPGMSL
jgi:hypothetical protein